MTMTQDMLSAEVERLRALLSKLAFADGRRHDELMEKTRSAIVRVRKSRAALAKRDCSGRGPIDPS
jgi:hypothetical protein